MIIVSTSRAVLGKPSWSYRQFDDMEEAVDWIIDHDAEGYVGCVVEFLGGQCREVPSSEWGSQVNEIRASMAADRKHSLLYGRPGL